MTTSSDQDLRAALRTRLRSQRAAGAGAAVQTASEAVARRVAALPGAERWRRALAYVAVAGEIDPDHALALLGMTTVGLPRVDAGTMTFHMADDHHQCEPGVFGIPMPAADAPLVDPATVDVVLVPLVGFDDQGNRLGMGGGHYDRLLAATPGPHRVGLAHDRQRVPRLRTASWDMPLDVIVTPTMTLTPSPRRVR